MHLTDEQLNEYLDDETNERAWIELHLSICTDCAARLSALRDLFAEIESLPELELTRPIASRIPLSTNLPRSLTLTVMAQATFAVLALIVAAPFVMRFIPPYLSNLPAPSPVDLFPQLQSWWTTLLDTLSTFHFPNLPQIPMVELSSFFVMFTVIGVSLLWLIGNGLLLRNHIK